MSDATPPVQPVAPNPPPYATHPPAYAPQYAPAYAGYPPHFGGQPPVKRRLVWPWVVGGAAALMLLLVGGLTFSAFYFIAAQGSQVNSSIRTFDRAYKNSDCALLESVTTDAVRDEYTNGDYNCADWKSIADGFTIDGTYTFRVHIDKTSVNSGHATVLTTESYDDGTGKRVTNHDVYELELNHGTWIIISYEEK